jgi:hypothetical protein
MNARAISSMIAAVIATCGLCILVAGVNAHGDNVQRGFALLLAPDSLSAPSTSFAAEPMREARELGFGQSTGLPP